jgi:hypothetical protein
MFLILITIHSADFSFVAESAWKSTKVAAHRTEQLLGCQQVIDRPIH